MAMRVTMTKGQVEARISEAMSKFEVEYMGRGPEKVRTSILHDMIIIRLKGFLSVSEKNLASTKEGVELIKNHRRALFENARAQLIETVQSVLKIEIISVHSDVSTVTGEKIIILIADKEIEID
jgi:uncharacterized protein YbcI